MEFIPNSLIPTWLKLELVKLDRISFDPYFFPTDQRRSL